VGWRGSSYLGGPGEKGTLVHRVSANEQIHPDLAQNVFDGHTGTNYVGRVVHRKKDAGHDLNLQTDAA
jgi:hypothetical protein